MLSLSGNGNGSNVLLVNVQAPANIVLDVNQTAVALYKSGVLKDDARTLQKQDVDSDALPYLTEAALKEMGIPTFGRRIKIIKAAQAILSGAAGVGIAAATSSAMAATQPTPSSIRASVVSPTTPAAASSSSAIRKSPVASPSASSDDGVVVSADAGADADAGEVDEEPDEDIEVPNPKLAAIEAKEAAKKAKSSSEGEDDMFATEVADTGDSFMAVKPWLGAIKEPSNAPKNDPSPPNKKLVIDWVYGYRGFDSRSNLVYNGNGEVCYPTAALVVMAKNKEQKYMTAHDDDIRCLARNPADRNIIATGQNATVVNGKSQPPSICIFDSSAPKKPLKLKCEATDRCIRAVGFSFDGKYLCSASNDDNHTVKVWSATKGTMLASAKGDQNPIFGVRGNPSDSAEWVSVGQRHISFWKHDGSTLKAKKGSGLATPQTFYCAAYTSSGTVLAGAGDGNLYIFKGGAVSKTLPFHPKGKVLSIEPLANGGWVSGGSDKTVRVWDAKFVQQSIHTFSEHVVSVWPSDDGNDLLVGTRAGDVFEIRDFQSIAPIEGDEKLDAVTRGHKEGELWAIAVLPGGKGFVTAGEDNTICTWDIRHRLVKRAFISDKKGKAPAVRKASTTSSYPTNQCARGIAISPDKRHIVVGTNNGEIAVFNLQLERKYLIDLNSHGQRNVKDQTGNWIEALDFSPSGRTCAVGTHGSVVCLLDVGDSFKCKQVLKASRAAITALDWSVDGAYLQTVDLGYELLRYSIDENNLSNSKQVTSATAVKDVEWATHTCKFGWPVQGVFSGSQTGADIKGCDVSASKSLVVTGDTDGFVKLYRYPCLTGAQSNNYEAHSSFVVRSRFTPDERFVLTTGGHDLTTIQWAIV